MLVFKASHSWFIFFPLPAERFCQRSNLLSRTAENRFGVAKKPPVCTGWETSLVCAFCFFNRSPLANSQGWLWLIRLLVQELLGFGEKLSV